MNKAEQRRLLKNYLHQEFADSESDPFLNRQKIINTIKPQAFYPLIREIYDSLDNCYNFNNSENYRSELIFTIRGLAQGYAHAESTESENKALRSTLLFSLLIVTIPFCGWFYRKKLAENRAKQHFQIVFFNDALTKAYREEKGGQYSFCLLNKTIENYRKPNPRANPYSNDVFNSDKFIRFEKGIKPFKDVFFSSKNKSVRKFKCSSGPNSSGEPGIKLLGTTAQLKKTKDKLKQADSLSRRIRI